MATSILAIIFTVFIILGVALTVVPFMSALLYMFIMAFIFAALTGFKIMTFGKLAILAIIVVLSITNDFLSGVLGAKWSGATKKGLIYGVVGLIAGFIMLPPFGGLIGLFIGIFIAEIIFGMPSAKALKAATGSLVGALAGMIINIFLALTFISFFIIFLFV